MNVVREGVEKLVEKELEEAIKLHGLNHSYHEKIALVAEEFDECADELEELKSNLQNAWQWTKVDGNEHVMDELYSKIYKGAVRLACEAIQVAAMAKKEVDREVGNGTAEISDNGLYSGKDPVRVFYCNACRNDFVSGNRQHPHFCPECGAEFTNVLRF